MLAASPTSCRDNALTEPQISPPHTMIFQARLSRSSCLNTGATASTQRSGSFTGKQRNQSQDSHPTAADRTSSSDELLGTNVRLRFTSAACFLFPKERSSFRRTPQELSFEEIHGYAAHTQPRSIIPEVYV